MMGAVGPCVGGETPSFTVGPMPTCAGGHVEGRRKAVGSVPADGFANSGERGAGRNRHPVPRLNECERSRLSLANV